MTVIDLSEGGDFACSACFVCFISMLAMEIIYKKGLRNGYAKVVEGKVVLTIPFFARNDKNFLAKMKILGEKLQQKIEKKEKNQIFSTEGVLLF